MGYIRMHLWTLLHFPLHVGLLLTVEGASTLVLWNSSIKWFHFIENFVEDIDWNTIGSNDELCTLLTGNISSLSANLKTNLTEMHNYREALRAIGKLDFSSSASTWTDDATELVYEIFIDAETAVFEAFFPGPGSDTTQTVYEKLDAVSSRFETVIQSFYIAAGLFLVLLAALYWMGKRKKDWEEWAALALRVLAGVGLLLNILADHVRSASSKSFLLSPWLIPVVTLGYLLVIVIDSILIWYTNKQIDAGRRPVYQEMKQESARDLPDARGDCETTAGLLAGYHVKLGDTERGV